MRITYRCKSHNTHFSKLRKLQQDLTGSTHCIHPVNIPDKTPQTFRISEHNKIRRLFVEGRVEMAKSGSDQSM